MLNLACILLGFGLGINSAEVVAASIALAVFWLAEYHPTYGRLTK